MTSSSLNAPRGKEQKGFIVKPWEVPGLLDGSITQLRRVMKPQPEFLPAPTNGVSWRHGKRVGWGQDYSHFASHAVDRAPYAVGDVLYVKETWGVGCRPCPVSGWYDGIEYKADVGLVDPLPCRNVDDVCFMEYASGWHSPATMPRRFSRLSLEVTAVRPERIQDVTDEDVIAEGILDGGCLHCGMNEPCTCAHPTPSRRDSYINRWMSTYGDASWHGNDWTWAYTIRPISLSTGAP